MKDPRTIRTALVLATLLALPRFALAAPIVIHWWHSHGDYLEEPLAKIREGFNRSQDEYRIVATYKGLYQETMHAGFAAIRAGTPPHILQVYEVGTGTMVAAKDAIKPMYEVMQESGLPFDADAYLPMIARSCSRRLPALLRSFQPLALAPTLLTRAR